jgi:hypothetical protein
MSAPDPSLRTPTPAACVPEKSPPNGRDAKGRFTRDNSDCPGNPVARKKAAVCKALVDAVTEADMQEIATILLLKAKQGDLAAIKLLFSYVIGKPETPANPDTLNRHEWQTSLGNLVSPLELETVLGTWPLDLLCAILPGLVMARRGECQQVFEAILQAAEQRNPTRPVPSQNGDIGAEPCAAGGLPANVCGREDTGGQAASGTERKQYTGMEPEKDTGRQGARGMKPTATAPLPIGSTAVQEREEIIQLEQLLERCGIPLAPLEPGRRQETGQRCNGGP